MGIQNATASELENAQLKIVAKTLFTEEHSAPVSRLFDQFRLGDGEKTITVPKVGQMTAATLVDGIDLVDSEDINMTTLDVSPVESGLKVVLTTKLVRQMNEDVWAIVGRQTGEAMARKKERDCIALFVNLNGGTALGGDGKLFLAINQASVINKAKANKMGSNARIVHHPNALFAQTFASVVNASQLQLPERVADKLLKNFYAYTYNGVPFFESGNIDAIDAGTTDSGYGAIWADGCMGIVTAMGLTSKTQEDISLRATELVIVEDYLPFEADDKRGFPLQYEVLDVVTNT